MFVERESIINYLLQQCDAKNQQIQQLQVQLAEANKKLDATAETAKTSG